MKLNRKSVAIAALALVAFVLMHSVFAESSAKRVQAAEAHQLVSEGARLVDVRTPEEFAAKHLPNAQNIPLADLASRQHELAPKSRPIVLYCRSGRRSAEAKKVLDGAGFSRVYDLGPIGAW